MLRYLQLRDKNDKKKLNDLGLCAKSCISEYCKKGDIEQKRISWASQDISIFT